jgi:hypothetical protein
MYRIVAVYYPILQPRAIVERARKDLPLPLPRSSRRTSSPLVLLLVLLLASPTVQEGGAESLSGRYGLVEGLACLERREGREEMGVGRVGRGRTAAEWFGYRFTECFGAGTR